MELTFEEITASAGGLVAGGRPGGPAAVTGLSTDTRTIAAGDVFVALRGERFDGHDHLARAADAGAALLIVEHGHSAAADPEATAEARGGAVLAVPDTLEALGRIARAWRRKFPDLPVAAIVGSSGKTTTKEMLADITAAHLSPTLVTPGNLNNRVGLPQTLARLTADHRAAVLELGMNQPGEAAALIDTAEPGLVCLTNIRDAHVGMFGGLEALYRGECESLEHAPPGARFLLNADDELSRRARHEVLGGKDADAVSLFSVAREAAIGAGADPAEISVWAEDIVPRAPYGYDFVLRFRDSDEAGTGAAAAHPVSLHVFGRHNVANAAAAAGVARWLGITPRAIAAGLTAFRPRLNRSEVEEVHGWWVLKDYYNAVPSAVKSALASMVDFHLPTGGRRFAVLGDMRELGDLEAEAHRDVGRAAAAAGLERLVCVGDRAAMIREAAAAAGMADRAEHVADVTAAADRVSDLIRPGDLLLIKGSRLMALERVYDLLTGNDSGDGH